MKLFDFDSEFYKYARSWIATHPGLRETEIEARYNEMLQDWLDSPAEWLDGAKPGEYFERYADPQELTSMFVEYMDANIGLPEPLYRRIVDCGKDCLPLLMQVAADDARPEAMRATALALIRDIDSEAAADLYIKLVCAAQDKNELSEMAAEALRDVGSDIIKPLMDRYDSATDYGQLLMLDICAGFPEDARISERLIDRLRKRPGERALYAALLGKHGDPGTVEPMKQIMRLTDLGYLEYIELRCAIEQLGGDPGEERIFNGDPDYEALRNL